MIITYLLIYNDIQTCMLLKRLNVLLQTEQENWVGPTRIWEREGIQYCPCLAVKPSWFPLVSFSETGGPIWRATVTSLGFVKGRLWSISWFEEGLVLVDLWLLGYCWPGGPRRRTTESSSPEMQYWLLLNIEEREGDIKEKDGVWINGGERQWRLDELVTNKWFVYFVLTFAFVRSS